MIHLKSVTKGGKTNNESYPFHLPFIKNFKEISFSNPVTIIVGENGTGKSTLLEAIATNMGSILIGGENIDSDPTLGPARELGMEMKLVWTIKTRKGFFFRANDFINFASRLAAIRQESKDTLQEIKKRDPHSLEVLPYARTLYDLQNLYGEGLDVRSHGESFLDLFQARFQPDGIYILDEPEAPLSPLKQLTLISMINDMVVEGGQFIIATHSPILMAIPNADIFAIIEDELKQVDYEEVEHVKLTRDFLNNPERFLRHLN
ncbi:AAA family ATPase [Ornithinibacillus californiensis]|uniref:AAA family ATPase n=1 Tax=Ornithinibacillus californiensis TaxID=161536 RepID=UPI00064D942E|nr:AAA family ATPase [Ornithinibacillus californiensis]